ncbi:NAD(P)/FAD-dependent oxidoreductase [Christiangramia aquimixticola]|uniref:NAD(P)/FAD-dependent oxidoreductase n=1 Tax=Christiangramia aquimixticola TaxID=1697558 RepID=UPI003AA88A88
MINYIIVGLGLSGLAVAEELEKRSKSFVVFDDDSQKSSLVAGGIFNPVILKRFTPAWKAAEQLDLALEFYRSLEQKLDAEFIHKWNIYRRFHSVEEQNDWFVALDKPGLQPFMDPSVQKISNPSLEAQYGFGMVKYTGNIDTNHLLDRYKAFLLEKKALVEDRFVYDDLKKSNDLWEYRGHQAKGVIFCEGFGLKRNPYFNYLPLKGNKGEYIIVKSPGLKLEHAIKASVFIMPMGNDLYKVGATYEHQDKTPYPTESAKKKLGASLKSIITCEFEVVDQVAGIRPAMVDRRPVVGKHPDQSGLYCCNGFGSRGVLIAPYVAPELLRYIEDGTSLDKEIDLSRFTRKHYNSR